MATIVPHGIALASAAPAPPAPPLPRFAAPTLPEAVGEGLNDEEGDVPGFDGDGEAVAGVGEADREVEAVPEATKDLLGEPVLETVRLMEGVAETEAPVESEAVGVGVGEPVLDAEGVALSVRLDVGVAVGVRLAQVVQSTQSGPAPLGTKFGRQPHELPASLHSVLAPPHTQPPRYAFGAEPGPQATQAAAFSPAAP